MALKSTSVKVMGVIHLLMDVDIALTNCIVLRCFFLVVVKDLPPAKSPALELMVPLKGVWGQVVDFSLLPANLVSYNHYDYFNIFCNHVLVPHTT